LALYLLIFGIIKIQNPSNQSPRRLCRGVIDSKSAKKPGREIFNQMMARVYESSEPVGILSWHPFMSIV